MHNDLVEAISQELAINKVPALDAAQFTIQAAEGTAKPRDGVGVRLFYRISLILYHWLSHSGPVSYPPRIALSKADLTTDLQGPLPQDSGTGGRQGKFVHLD